MNEATEHLRIRPASALRQDIQSRERQARLERQRREAAKAEARAAFAKDFLTNPMTEAEWEVIDVRIEAAVANGRFDALICSFPSDLCTDSGRAINNRQDGWPETLRGKAREVYDTFLAQARPAGYRLKATIISFPNGIPGDVGLFLDWSSEPI